MIGDIPNEAMLEPILDVAATKRPGGTAPNKRQLLETVKVLFDVF